MWSYLGGITKGFSGKPYAIGGTDDHVHLLLAIPADVSISKAVNLLKSNSSKWMREQDHKFGWQRGYAAFSVSVSNLVAVTKYIDNQEELHTKRSFEQEWLALLRKHNVEFDPRYVLD